MPDGVNRDECLRKVANLQGDTLCAQISDRENRLECFYHSNLGKKDSSHCDTISITEERDQCYAAIGWTTKKMSDCEKISNLSSNEYHDYPSSPRESCISDAAENIETCLSLSSEEPKRLCIYHVASKNEDYTLCSQNENQRYKDLCYRDFALNKGIKEPCNLIIDSNLKDYCFNSKY